MAAGEEYVQKIFPFLALALEGEGWVGVDYTQVSSADARKGALPLPQPLPVGEERFLSPRQPQQMPHILEEYLHMRPRFRADQLFVHISIPRQLLDIGISAHFHEPLAPLVG